nr:MAG TPA: hypothetical protein [Caudoviricetes sp.]
MLSDYPVKINGIELFPSSGWEQSHSPIENIYQTEAGTDQISVTRYDKLTVTAKYRCQSEWLGIFSAFSKLDTLQVEIYDEELDAYKLRNMRMRNYKKTLIEFSEKVKDTKGVWDVSFSLEEF